MTTDQNQFAFLGNNNSGSVAPTQSSAGDFGFLRPQAAPVKLEPVSTEEIGRLAKEEGVDHLLPVVHAIYGQESGSGANSATSINGAGGGMQIMPNTFNRYAKAGENISNPSDNMRVGMRIVKDLGNKFGNDPARIAAGYFSGEGNVNAGTGNAWKEDRQDGNGKSVSSYVSDVLGRIQPQQQAQTQQASNLPDLSNIPKWGQIAASPRFQALSPEDQISTKEKYFNDVIAPYAGNDADKVREQFLAQPSQSLSSQVDQKAAAVVPGAIPAIRDALKPNSVMNGYVPDDKPVTTPTYSDSLANSKTLRDVDTSVDNRRARLISQGEDPAFAQRAAEEGAAAGIPPGMEVAYLQNLTGTAQNSNFDFDTNRAFKDQAGLNNPVVRGAAKAAIGTGKALSGYTEFMGDVLGIDGMRSAGAEAGKWARGKEDAIGENGTYLERNLEGAINSIGQQLPLMFAGVKSASEAIPLAGMAMQSFGQEYSDGRSAGLNPVQAMERASIYAAFEVIGEKFGLHDSMEAIKAASNGLPNDKIIGFLWSALKKEVPGEELTTAGQFLTDKLPGIGLNQNASGEDYLKQAADTFMQTIMQSGVMAGGTTGVGTAVRYMNDKSGNQKVAEIYADAARQKALDRWNAGLLGVPRTQPNAPVGTPDAVPAADQEIPQDAGGTPGQVQQQAPIEQHPTSQIADGIVADIAQQHGVPAELLLPESSSALQQGDTVPDQDAMDYAEMRYQQLMQKQHGQIRQVATDKGLVNEEVPGQALSPAEEQELAALQAAHGDINQIRSLYGFSQAAPIAQSSNPTPPVPAAQPNTGNQAPEVINLGPAAAQEIHHEKGQVQVQAEPDRTGASQNAIERTGQGGESTAQQQSAAAAPATAENAELSQRDTRQQISDQGASQALSQQFDVSGRTDQQLRYLAEHGQNGWREAATAELQKRQGNKPIPQGHFNTAEEAAAFIKKQRRSSGNVPRALPLPYADGTFGIALEKNPGWDEAVAYQKANAPKTEREAKERRQKAVVAKEAEATNVAEPFVVDEQKGGNNGTQAEKAVSPESRQQAQEPISSPVKQGATADHKFVEMNDVYGTKVRVRQSDVDSDREKIPLFSKHGNRIGLIHRDNLDPTGEKKAANDAEVAKNPLLNVVTAKDGNTFQTESAAKAFATKNGYGGTHRPVPAGSIKSGLSGYVLERKPKTEQEAKVIREQRKVASEKLPKPKTETVANTKPEGAQINDFGEKIGGARKDVWSGFRDSLNAVKDEDIGAEPLSKVWPEPDYQKLVNDGVPSDAVATIRALRDEIPAKPRSTWKVMRWSDQVKMLREFASDVLDGKITLQKIKEMAGSTQALGKVFGRIELYQAVGHEKSLKGVNLSFHHYTLYKGRENVSLWAVEQDAKATAWSNFPREIATGDTKEEAIEGFKQKYSNLDIDKPADKQVSFEIYTKIHESGFWIGKKVGRNKILLEGPFSELKAARSYMAENNAKLVEKLEKAKEVPSERRASNEPRVGVDMRNGQDVTPKLFSDTFGFRGVEFGNWVEQGRRQQDLNDAFDALMDMAAILNVPPRALSLNGELGLAFGARGTGGIRAAKAHYEYAAVAINLTKREGAGSLGHEWWHALDNYFSRSRNKATSMMTEALDVSLASRGAEFEHSQQSVRPEMIQAFGNVVRAINQTAIKARSAKLDAKRSNEYWTTKLEMSARAFESYLISKLQDQNASNDYLANIVDHDTWKVAEALGFELGDSYPYPTAGEIPAIRTAFDELFQAIETKETDKGIAFFSRGRANGGMAIRDLKAIADRARASFSNLPAVHVMKSPDSLDLSNPAQSALFDEISKRGALRDVEGVAHNGEIYLFSDNIKDEFRAEHVLVNHEVFHYGLRETFGRNGVDPILNTIYMSNATVRNAANALKEQLGLSSNAEATEEVLADMAPQDLVQLNAWRRLVRYVRDWLSNHGMTGIAKRLNDLLKSGMTDQQKADMLVADVVNGARDWVRNGKEASASAIAETRFSEDRGHGVLPDAVILGALGDLNSNPSYEAAKHGDAAAAIEVAKAILTPGAMDKIKSAIGDEKPIIVPVISKESSGHNQIPLAAALLVGKELGLQVSDNVYQATSPKRTAMDGVSRIFGSPQFEGKVEAGKTYALVDDTITQGATFAELAGFIHEHGGKVVANVALTGKQYSAKLQVTKETVGKLRDKFGDIEDQFQAATGHRFDSLTESEARYLSSYKPADTIRDRILAEGIKRGSIQDAGNPSSGLTQGAAAPELSGSNQTDTPAFKKWFGDSKVVDAAGKPLVMYHGTSKDFTGFDLGLSRRGREGSGMYFTDNRDLAGFYADGDGANVMPVYIRSVNPLTVSSPEDAVEKLVQLGETVNLDEFQGMNNDDMRSMLERHGFDSLMYDSGLIIAMRPEQIKSATGNNGEFDASNPDIRFSRNQVSEATRNLQNKAIQFFGNQEDSLKTFNWFNLRINTQYHKALKDKDFGRVYNLVQSMQNHVAMAAARPAELAPGILYRVDGVGHAVKTIFNGHQREAIKKAGEALFAGTLAGNNVMEGKIWSEDELRSKFGLDDQGVALYQQARKAIDASIDEVASAEAYAIAQEYLSKSTRDSIIASPIDAKPIIIHNLNRKIALGDRAGLDEESMRGIIDAINKVEQIFEQSEKLQEAGYAPLMRFGKYDLKAMAVDPETRGIVRDENGNPMTLFYGRYDSQGQLRAAERELKERYADKLDEVRIIPGVVNESANELYRGVNPETLSLFAEAIGQKQATDEYIRLVRSERSSLKRKLERKGTPGYSTDMQRVLANFVTSNGRQAAQQFYGTSINKAIRRIPKEKGDVQKEAINLRDYVIDPNDKGAFGSSLMFAWFLGGSPAAAAVNMTQPIMMTLPFLSQYGTALAASEMTKAVPYAMGKKEMAPDLRAGLKKASLEGIVDAQEVFHLYSMGSQQLASGPRSQALMTLWGSMFAGVEGLNRRLTFIAAWNIAKAKKMENPYAFATDAVNQTQGIYNKANRPNWARSTVGRALFTFKTYSIAYAELMNRMWKSGSDGKKAVLLMMAVMILAAGEEGLPGAKNLDDLIDTIGQWMGYDTNMKRWKRRHAYELLGKVAGDLVLYGVSSMLPMDFGGRLGLGNIVPGTSILKPSDGIGNSKAIAEIAGPTAGAASQVGDFAQAIEEHNYGKAITNLAPKSVRDAVGAAEMLKSGHATDAAGRKTVDTSASDALIKAAGFNPTSVAERTRATMPVQQDIALAKKTEAAIVADWAQAIVDNDQDGIKKQQERLIDWNKDNPDSPIKINASQIRSKVAGMTGDKNSRIAKTAPREMRGRVGLDLVK